MEVLEGASTLEQSILRQARLARLPANGSIEITPLCNMNCDMCYVRLSRAEMEAQGVLKRGEDWLRLGREMKAAGVLFLLITGGEPLVHPDFKEIYLGLRELGMILTVNTNGTLIDQGWADFFGQYPPRRINITLYGADEETYGRLCHYPGGFHRTLEAVRLLKQQGVEVKLGCSLTKTNRDSWDKILRLGEELNVPVRQDTYMCPATRERSLPFQDQVRLDPEDAARLRAKLLRAEMGDQVFQQAAALHLQKAGQGPREPGNRRMRCMAGSCSFAINWQGRMRPCVIATEPWEDAFALGFSAAWTRIVAATEQILSGSVCAHCRLREVCITCPLYALYECGSYEGVPEYICRYTRETLRALREEAGLPEPPAP